MKWVKHRNPEKNRWQMHKNKFFFCKVFNNVFNILCLRLLEEANKVRNANWWERVWLEASGWEIGEKSSGNRWEIPRDSREAEESASCLFAETPTSKRKRCCEKDLMADDAIESWSGLFSIHRFRAEEARCVHWCKIRSPTVTFSNCFHSQSLFWQKMSFQKELIYSALHLKCVRFHSYVCAHCIA